MIHPGRAQLAPDGLSLRSGLVRRGPEAHPLPVPVRDSDDVAQPGRCSVGIGPTPCQVKTLFQLSLINGMNDEWAPVSRSDNLPS